MEGRGLPTPDRQEGIQAGACDFLLYCRRNPKPSLLVEVSDSGDPEPRMSAPGADLRTDLPRYAIYRRGVREEDVTDIRHLWRNDSAAFFIGSGMTFDDPFERMGVPKVKTLVLTTALQTAPAGQGKQPAIGNLGECNGPPLAPAGLSSVRPCNPDSPDRTCIRIQ